MEILCCSGDGDRLEVDYEAIADEFWLTSSYADGKSDDVFIRVSRADADELAKFLTENKRGAHQS